MNDRNMQEITPDMIKVLRDATGCCVLSAKKALIKSNGNVNEAKKYIVSGKFELGILKD